MNADTYEIAKIGKGTVLTGRGLEALLNTRLMLMRCLTAKETAKVLARVDPKRRK